MTSTPKGSKPPAGWDKLPPKIFGKQARGESLKNIGRMVIEIEAEAVKALAARIGDDFARACRHMRDCEGRVIVLGVGKSGHVASKIAATLASTGTPAFFVHPAEARHGDLGMIKGKDVVLAISNSGKTEEILAILPAIKSLKVVLIAMTGNPGSPLARAARVHLDVGVEREACPLESAPTASTTAALAMGDALAIAILQAKEQSQEDFARSHPGGALGRRLLAVSTLMHSGPEMPKVGPDTSLRDVLVEMSSKGLGMTAVVDANDHLLGVFTDGDLRRALDRGIDLRDAKARDVMTSTPRTVPADLLAAEAVRVMEAHGISALVVVDGHERPVGALNMHDLLRAGVV